MPRDRPPRIDITTLESTVPSAFSAQYFETLQRIRELIEPLDLTRKMQLEIELCILAETIVENARAVSPLRKLFGR